MALRDTCVRAALVVSILWAPALPAQGDEFRVRMAASPASFSIRRALQGAHGRLGREQCRKLFTDYADGEGRPLQDRLDTLGLTPERYLGYIGFYEGHGQDRCRSGAVLAFTQPGSLAVRVCPQVARYEPELLEMIVIHELLHSLGLEENPPTSLEITDQVRRRCGDGSVIARTASGSWSSRRR